MTALIMTADRIGLHSLAEWFKKLNEKRKHRAMVKRTMHELSRLSDRELWDMGISRCDIWSVAHGHDPRTETNNNLKGWV